MARITDLATGYRWREVNGVIEITSGDVPNSFLDRVVPSFEIRNGSLAEALGTVERIFDPTYPTPRPPTFVASSGDPNANAPENLEKARAAFSKPVSVSLTNTTVRQILDAIVVSDGETSCFVRYRTTPAEYKSSQLIIEHFDGYGWDIYAR